MNLRQEAKYAAGNRVQQFANANATAMATVPEAGAEIGDLA